MSRVFELLLWHRSKKQMLNYPISTLPLVSLFVSSLFIPFQRARTHPPPSRPCTPPPSIAFSAAFHLQIITLLPKTPSDKQSMCAYQ